MRVNQRVNNNTWVSLGTFNLDANSSITLTDDADGLVIADAVKIFPGTAGTLRYVQSDHLGTPRAVVDAAKHLRWRWESDPFGSIPPDNNPEGFGAYEFNLRFPGQYFDKETGLHYNYFRDYDPSIGRYVQSDPIGLDGGINTYHYVGGNPLISVDPLGLAGKPKPWFDPKKDNVSERTGPTDQSGRVPRTGEPVETGPDRPPFRDKVQERILDKIIEHIVGVPAAVSQSSVGIFIWGMTYTTETGGCDEYGRCQDMIYWPPKPLECR